MNISLEEVQAKMLELKIDPIKVQQVITELEKVVEEIKEEKEATKEPKQKQEYVIVLYDKENVLDGKEIAGWVVQKPLDDDANLILSKLAEAAKAQNEVTKKKKNRIDDLVSLFEHLKSKFTKEKKVKIKTKELTRCIIASGKLV